MASDPRSERLERLEEEVGRSLRLMIGRSPFRATAKGIQRVDAKSVAGPATVRANWLGGIALLDDERGMRVLAKEIKRLITEDKRRGLAV